MFPPVATNLGIVLIYTVKNIILSCSLLATNLGIVLIYTVKNKILSCSLLATNYRIVFFLPRVGSKSVKFTSPDPEFES